MTGAARWTAAVLGLALAAGAAPARGQDEDSRPDRGVVAVLRQDGIVAPFASFRGTSWQTPWPAGLVNVELPVNLASIPDRWWGGNPPESWEAWPIGGEPRPLKANAPQIYPVHCEQRLGLRTDFKPDDPPPPMQVEPFPKAGLAVSGGARVEPIESVEPGTEWTRLAVALLDDVNRAEDREVSDVSRVFRHPVDRDDRHARPIQLEHWYRTTLEDGATVSYIEAVRSYPPGPEDEGCGLQTLVSGWVIHDPERREPRVDLAARITYCDRVGAAFMQPFGRIRVRDRVYWIAQVAGPEAEWYLVAQVSSRRVVYVAEYLAGRRESCPVPGGR